jgi:hypothetical protein
MHSHRFQFECITIINHIKEVLVLQHLVRHSMSDSAENIINFDATQNTVIRVREQSTINQTYYPRQGLTGKLAS